MARNISTYIGPAFTLAPAATANMDVRLTDVNQGMALFLVQTWTATATGGTGVVMNLYPGYGAADPAENPFNPIPCVLSNPSSGNKSTVPIFASNPTPVTKANGYADIAQPALGDTNAKTVTEIFVPLANPDWLRVQLYSLDPTNTGMIQLLAKI